MNGANDMKATIDTNVFIDLFNTTKNDDSHIEQLLSHLIKKKCELCVDQDRINGEYHAKMQAIIESSPEGRFGIYFIRYFMNMAKKHVSEVELDGPLLKAIRNAFKSRGEIIDQIFVAVACMSDTKLITNDKGHIVDRRSDIMKATKKLRSGSDMEICTSREAIAKVVLKK